MAVSLRNVFCWVLLHVGYLCDDVDIASSKSVTFLTRYGYRYYHNQGSFTFKVKCCYEALVRLCETEGVSGKCYVFYIGGWSNTKVALQYKTGLYLTKDMYKPVRCSEYKPYWISWGYNDEVVLGRGEEIFKDALITMSQSVCRYQVRYVGISDRFANGHWKVPRLRIPQKWHVLPIFRAVNMTSQTLWTEDASNPGACGIHCRQDPLCVSFTFNANKRICQGHNQTLSDINEGQGHIEHGCYYFTVFK